MNGATVITEKLSHHTLDKLGKVMRMFKEKTGTVPSLYKHSSRQMSTVHFVEYQSPPGTGGHVVWYFFTRV
eukprot:1208695-Karenia_brevis.AAC.1